MFTCKYIQILAMGYCYKDCISCDPKYELNGAYMHYELVR
jgi:hypothetical protein